MRTLPRWGLVATVVASYGIASLAAALCLWHGTEQYRKAVEVAEDHQLAAILQQEVTHLAWDGYADHVRGLARDISQETSDPGTLATMLPQMWRRAAVTAGYVQLLDVEILAPDGAVLAQAGTLTHAASRSGVAATLPARQGADRARIITRVWSSDGQPVLSVIHPIGGLRPVGYLAVHANPILALADLDKRLGVGVSFLSPDGTRPIAAPQSWPSEANAHTHLATTTIMAPDGSPVLRISTARDVSEREARMAQIRFWSFVSLVGVLMAVAVAATMRVLFLTHRIATAEAAQRSQMAFDNMTQGVAMFDAHDRLVVCNEVFARLYGLSPGEVEPGATFGQLLERSHATGIYGLVSFEALQAGWLASFRKAATHVQIVGDGHVLAVTRRSLPDGGMLSTTEDVTERHRVDARLQQQYARVREQEEMLRAQNVLFEATLNNIVQGVALFDEDECLLLCNPRYREIYEIPQGLQITGMMLRQLVELGIDQGTLAGTDADAIVGSHVKQLDENDPEPFTMYLADGRCILITVQPIVDGKGFVTTHQDVTAQRRSEAKIAHIAMHDTLTGLPNRAMLNQELEVALGRTRRGETIAIHFLDLDNFKTVNDTMGHPVGDKLLEIVAARLRVGSRETDTVARMGGDEFAIVQSLVADTADIVALAQRTVEIISEPYEIDGQQIVVGTSVGIAIAPQDGEGADELMRNADLALYRAKGDGRGTFRFFEPEMNARVQERRSLERELREALAGNQFALHFQPVFSLAEDRITGFEALLRWSHPTRGLISPVQFIALAEETMLIAPIGDWVIREACGAATQWPNHVRVAVNLSVAQFRNPLLADNIIGALGSSGLDPKRLELEITESLLLDRNETTLGMLHRLRAIGARIVMDDFGTGYSSLSYLQSFPFDKIKIDQSFIRRIEDGDGSLSIVRAVSALAAGLGIATTAEGVETRAQMDIVRAEGCSEMQGFLLSRPVRLDQIPSLLGATVPERQPVLLAECSD